MADERYTLEEDCDSDLNPIWEIYDNVKGGLAMYRFRNEIEARRKLEELREQV